MRGLEDLADDMPRELAVIAARRLPRRQRLGGSSVVGLHSACVVGVLARLQAIDERVSERGRALGERYAVVASLAWPCMRSGVQAWRGGLFLSAMWVSDKADPQICLAHHRMAQRPCAHAFASWSEGHRGTRCGKSS